MHREDRFGGHERRSFAPVQVGDEVDVKIEAVGEKGDGIAKIKGFVIFVANVKQGEDVKIRITKVLRKVGFGEVVSGSSGSNSKKSQKEESQDEGSEDTSSEETKSEGSEENTDSEEFGEDDSQEEEY